MLRNELRAVQVVQRVIARSVTYGASKQLGWSGRILRQSRVILLQCWQQFRQRELHARGKRRVDYCRVRNQCSGTLERVGQFSSSIRVVTRLHDGDAHSGKLRGSNERRRALNVLLSHAVLFLSNVHALVILSSQFVQLARYAADNGALDK